MVPSTVTCKPDGELANEMVTAVLVIKLATIFLGVFMVIEIGLVEPEASPDQELNMYPVLGVA